MVSDVDYFRIDLAAATHVFVRAVSNTVDIDGALLDSSGDSVTTNLFEQDFRSGDDGYEHCRDRHRGRVRRFR